jgi:Lar family restriction alleviation protein
MDERLKPCPFCGSPGLLERLGGLQSEYRTAKCSRCPCDLHFYPTEESAIYAWNKRAGAVL